MKAPIEGSTMLERRAEARTRAFEAGTVAFGRHRATLDCVVRNLSEGGALLLLDDPRRAPVDMDLEIRGGGPRPARVVWRGEVAVGVVFTPGVARPASGTVVSLDAVRRRRAGPGDERRLAERVARFVPGARRPEPA